MNKTARLIITLECNRQCFYCINTPTVLASAIHIDNLEVIKEYPIVCITGGEPMLNPYRTIRIIEQLKEQNPAVKIYLYTAMYGNNIPRIIMLVDGINYTLHAGATPWDMKGFSFFQGSILLYGRTKSFCLRIFPGMGYRICTDTGSWKCINKSRWLEGDECKVANGEVLYIYEGGR